MGAAPWLMSPVFEHFFHFVNYFCSLNNWNGFTPTICYSLNSIPITRCEIIELSEFFSLTKKRKKEMKKMKTKCSVSQWLVPKFLFPSKKKINYIHIKADGFFFKSRSFFNENNLLNIFYESCLIYWPLKCYFSKMLIHKA